MIKRYDPNDNGSMRRFVGMDEDELGDWVKYEDFLKLKSEIIQIVERGIAETDAKSQGTANYLFRDILAKLTTTDLEKEL